MEFVQSLATRQTLAMTQRMQASLRILHMNNHDLSEFLAKKAEENPFLDVRLPSFTGSAGGEEFDQIAALNSEAPSLYRHIAEQIELSFDDPRDRQIAFACLERLEPTGWLTANLNAIAMACRVPLSVVEKTLERLQWLEPAGIFARSLAECLRLQAEDAGVLTWELVALIDNLPLLAEGRHAELAEICDCAPEDLPEITATLRQFDPKPGLRFADDRPPLFPPDLTAKQVEGQWVVELNRSSLPALEIVTPADGVGAGNSTDLKEYRARALSEARWLASALVRRQTTLLQTATVIVTRQKAFLENAQPALEPLSLADIGEELDFHPSTISRAVSGRMIDTPLGALPLKSFFSRSFPSNQNGETASQDAVLQLVRQIVGAEDPKRPLSDTAIAKRAGEQGVTIARRTVAKFRGILGIASSYDRRKQAVPV